jgi:hypothetical protein
VAKSIRCRGCNGNLLKGDGPVVCVTEGTLDLQDEIEDFDESAEGPWGYMHKKCFLLAVGDPSAVTMMTTPEPG